MAQSLNAAVLSKDAQFIAVIREVLAPHEIELSELDDAMRFIDLVSQQPQDLVVLDCEGTSAIKQLVSTVRQNSANREAVVIVAGLQGDAEPIMAAGANVLLSKPLPPAKAQQFLHEAIEVIRKRHRQYVRHPLQTDVLLVSESKKLRITAKSYSIGEGGMGLQLEQHLELGPQDVVRLSFQLPGTNTGLEISATMVYINSDFQAGFRFQPLSTANSAKLNAWLNQQAPPPAGTPRKELVEQWLAEHGKESGTVVISAAIGKQLLAENLAAEKAAAAAAAAAEPEAPVAMPAPEVQPKPTRAKMIAYTVVVFLLGLASGLLLARFH
ncbi:MAG: PilZ domain-containing protein [Terriglobales bacterium]